MTVSPRALVVALSASLMFVTACSSDTPPTTPTGPSFTSLDEISQKLGCKNSQSSPPIDTSVKAAKDCELEGDQYLMLLQFDDAAKRDALLNSASTGMASWLVIGDTFSVGGMADTIIAAHQKVGGEVRAGVEMHDPLEPTASEEPTGPKPVAFGQPATYQGEQVKIDKVNCGTREKLQMRDFCRESVLKNFKDNPNYGDSEKDPNYNLPQYVDAKAAKGDEWYLVAFKWKNVSKKPISATPFGTVVSANGVEYDMDTTYSDRATENAIGNSELETNGDFNPGKGYRRILIYSIPKGTQVVGINWGFPYDGSDIEPEYRLSLVR